MMRRAAAALLAASLFLGLLAEVQRLDDVSLEQFEQRANATSE